MPRAHDVSRSIPPPDLLPSGPRTTTVTKAPPQARCGPSRAVAPGKTKPTLRAHSLSSSRGQSARRHQQCQPSCFPKTRPIRHSTPRSSPNDAWRARKHDAVDIDTVILRDDRLPEKSEPGVSPLPHLELLKKSGAQ